jgi:hypothetical protein
MDVRFNFVGCPKRRPGQERYHECKVRKSKSSDGSKKLKTESQAIARRLDESIPLNTLNGRK